MNKKLKQLFFVVPLLYICFLSCSKDNSSLLTVSETKLLFTKEASDRKVTVTTNQKQWNFITDADWMKITQSGNTFTIHVAENRTAIERKGKIMIMAGESKQEIDVVQQASDLVVRGLPHKIEIDQWGEERTYEMYTNTSDWYIISNAAWITVTSNYPRKEIMIAIAENKSWNMRKTVLSIVSEGKIKDVVIYQKGAMFYILPFLKFGENYSSVSLFEKSRHSIELNPKNYKTASPAFPLISYKFHHNNKLSEAIIFAGSPEVIKHKSFNTFITAHQFSLVSAFPDEENKSIILYENDNGNAFIEAMAYTAQEKAAVVFREVPYQPQNYPTFKKLPHGMNDFTANMEQVKAWEILHGGIFNNLESNPEVLHFDVKSPPWENRRYLMNQKDQVKQIDCLFSDITQAFYSCEGEYYLTREFKHLLKKEGFAFIEIVENPWMGRIYFYANNKREVIGASIIKRYESKEKLRLSYLFSSEAETTRENMNISHKFLNKSQ